MRERCENEDVAPQFKHLAKSFPAHARQRISQQHPQDSTHQPCRQFYRCKKWQHNMAGTVVVCTARLESARTTSRHGGGLSACWVTRQGVQMQAGTCA